jgi:hypothetical protein
MTDGRGYMVESWLCVDCGVNTAPGIPSGPRKRELIERGEGATFTIDGNSEVYTVRDAIWKRAGMTPSGGCLCIGCLEKRLGRMLKLQDFDKHDPFESPEVRIYATPRLRNRRGLA